jgi:hypothetical protein
MRIATGVTVLSSVSSTALATCYFPNGNVVGSDTACNPNAIVSSSVISLYLLTVTHTDFVYQPTDAAMTIRPVSPTDYVYPILMILKRRDTIEGHVRINRGRAGTA